MRARAACRWWRWVLTCLLLTFAFPAPAAAQIEDATSMVAEPLAQASEQVPRPARPAADAAAVATPHDAAGPVAASPPCRVTSRLYLWNCALLR